MFKNDDKGQVQKCDPMWFDEMMGGEKNQVGDGEQMAERCHLERGMWHTEPHLAQGNTVSFLGHQGKTLSGLELGASMLHPSNSEALLRFPGL